jgi:hypothetical protein
MEEENQEIINYLLRDIRECYDHKSPLVREEVRKLFSNEDVMDAEIILTTIVEEGDTRRVKRIIGAFLNDSLPNTLKAILTF